MKAVTLDTIVRNTLMDMGYPLHYYVRFLHYATRCLEEINYDFNFGKTSSLLSNASVANIKVKNIDVTSYNRAILPSDAVDVISVDARFEEHVLPLRFDPSLNVVQNFDANGNKIAYSEQDEITFIQESMYSINSAFSHINENGEFVGRFFGHVPKQDQSYNIDRGVGELVLNNNLKVTTLVVSYVTDGVTTSEANVVHPYAQDVISKYIKVQKYANGRQDYSKLGFAKQEYNNAKRKLRARLSNLSYADILASIRRGIHGSIKN